MSQQVSSYNLPRANALYKILKIFAAIFFTIILISFNGIELIKLDFKYLYSDGKNIDKLLKNYKNVPTNVLLIGIDTVYTNYKNIKYKHYEDFGDDETINGKFSLSEYINIKLRENPEFDMPDIIIIDNIVKFKDYSGYKKIYESRVREVIPVPMRDYSAGFASDVYITR